MRVPKSNHGLSILWDSKRRDEMRLRCFDFQCLNYPKNLIVSDQGSQMDYNAKC